MNITILTTDPFPIGMATTNRILSLTKGLALLQNNVKILILRPTENPLRIINKMSYGIYDGISYIYTSGNTIWPSTLTKKIYYSTKGIFRAYYFIRKERKKSKIDKDILVSCFDSFMKNMLFCSYARIFSIKFIRLVDEYPPVLIGQKNKTMLNVYLQTKLIHKLFDAIIVMTKNLYDYYQPRIRKKSKIAIIPMTVETDRFVLQGFKKTDKINYIAYCGNLGLNNKDGVPILIQAFGRVCENYPGIKLYLIGDTGDRNSNEFDKIKNLIYSLNLEKEIVLTGRVHRDKIPHYLLNAYALALARPNNLQAHGGFPTKLGEYLATGNPVIVTAVGEIPDYLEDGVNAFIAVPDNVESFAEKLEFVLKNPSIANEIGIAGQRVAREVFDYRVQSKNLCKFLEAL